MQIDVFDPFDRTPEGFAVRLVEALHKSGTTFGPLSFTIDASQNVFVEETTPLRLVKTAAALRHDEKVTYKKIAYSRKGPDEEVTYTRTFDLATKTITTSRHNIHVRHSSTYATELPMGTLREGEYPNELWDQMNTLQKCVRDAFRPAPPTVEKNSTNPQRYTS